MFEGPLVDMTIGQPQIVVDFYALQKDDLKDVVALRCKIFIYLAAFLHCLLD